MPANPPTEATVPEMPSDWKLPVTPWLGSDSGACAVLDANGRSVARQLWCNEAKFIAAAINAMPQLTTLRQQLADSQAEVERLRILLAQVTNENRFVPTGPSAQTVGHEVGYYVCRIQKLLWNEAMAAMHGEEPPHAT